MLKVLIATLLAALAAVPAAGAAPPVPPGSRIPPGLAVAVGVVRHITPEAALAAAQIPGAMTEVAPGLTLRQAVGLDTARRLQRRLATTQCWNNGGGVSWDIYPYDRHLNDSTSWCGSGGVLTYRSSHASQGQTICQPQGTYGYKIAGGAGETYVAWREGGYWSCATPIPWVTVFPADWMSIYVNGSGGYWIYEAGGN